MGVALESLIEQARTLPPEEQLKLAEMVYEMASPRDPEWEAAWVEECERRLAEYDRGEVEAEDFDVVMARLRRKYFTK